MNIKTADAQAAGLTEHQFRVRFRADRMLRNADFFQYEEDEAWGEYQIMPFHYRHLIEMYPVLDIEQEQAEAREELAS